MSDRSPARALPTSGPRERLRVLLAGGGSGGSTTPLLAVAEALREIQPEVELLYVGTAEGPERALVEAEGLAFRAVAAGKLRRYFSLANLVDPARVALGVAQSLAVVREFRPHVGFGAGGFASVPPLVACRLVGVPIAIHQQDVVPGLANRLLAPLAARVTVSLEASLAHFPQGKTLLTGNPVRASLFTADRARARVVFRLEAEVPTLLVTGGGTGALALNRLIAAAAARLVEFCQVIHLCGRGRQVPVPDVGPRYRGFDFLVSEMPLALAAADLVVCRAGLGTLSELAALGKPAIVVPMPDSHQVENGRAFAASGGVLVVEQAALTPERLVAEVRRLLGDPARLAEMGNALARAMPRGAQARIAKLLVSLATSG